MGRVAFTADDAVELARIRSAESGAVDDNDLPGPGRQLGGDQLAVGVRGGQFSSLHQKQRRSGVEQRDRGLRRGALPLDDQGGRAGDQIGRNQEIDLDRRNIVERHGYAVQLHADGVGGGGRPIEAVVGQESGGAESGPEDTSQRAR